MRREIDVPGDGSKRFVTTETVAAWLGISEEAFERLADRHPWLTKLKHGRKAQWCPEQIGVFALLMKWGALGEEK